MMPPQSYSSLYQQLQTLQSSPDGDYRLYLVRHRSELTYAAARKMSLLDCSTVEQDRILNQVRILKDMSHPHIVKYYDIFLEVDEVVLVLEFCEEGDLQYYAGRKSDKGEEFSEKLVLSWLMQVLMAVEHLHARNIIHRMIRPGNIFMNHQGDLKLGAFGGAKMLESSLDKATTVVGSPCDLSPEVAEGKPYDSKIDIWALGCLVYELCTHQHPFRTSSLPEMFRLIVKTPPQDLPVKYSKYLNPIYKKMMRKSPTSRPSASELLQEEVFIKLMKQYVRKKKIDSLDLREVVPRQLLAHRKNPANKASLPPLPGLKTAESRTKINMVRSNSSEKLPRNKSRQRLNREYDQSDKLPRLSPASETKQPAGRDSPKMTPKQSTLPWIPKPQRRTPSKLKPSSGAGLAEQPKPSPSRSPRVQQSSPEYSRLTRVDASEGEHISMLYQAKLELLQQKYSPNMSQILECTVEFDHLQ